MEFGAQSELSFASESPSNNSLDDKSNYKPTYSGISGEVHPRLARNGFHQ
jgi:hypothetical protein